MEPSELLKSTPLIKELISGKVNNNLKLFYSQILKVVKSEELKKIRAEEYIINLDKELTSLEGDIDGYNKLINILQKYTFVLKRFSSNLSRFRSV